MPYLPRPEKKVTPGWDRGTKSKFYHRKAWKAVRRLQLNSAPICEVCYESGTLTDCTRGGQIDHVIRIEDGGAPLDTANLMTMCREHHAKKSAMERHGLSLESTGQDGDRIPTRAAREKIKKLLT